MFGVFVVVCGYYDVIVGGVVQQFDQVGVDEVGIVDDEDFFDCYLFFFDFQGELLVVVLMRDGGCGDGIRVGWW